MSFPRYPGYKASGVEWLGEVPEGWSAKPLKHIAEFINGDTFKPSAWSESGLPIIRIQNLNGSEEFNYFDGAIESRYLVHDGDLLFGWSGNRGTSFGPFLWHRAEVCVLNQHIFRVVPKSLCKRALFWTLKAVTAHVEDQAHGIIGMVHITKGDLGAISVPLPPLPEQTAIAEFLDRETAKIDELVAEQRRLMELLKEKRQAVISHAVTQGLNPDAPMKPSGIEWLGDVPAHWVLVRLLESRRLLRIELISIFGLRWQ
jgi:type I restriction enzyme S subunit